MSGDAPLSPDRWEREFALKQADLRLRERQASWLHNPVFVGLIAAALALAGNVFATWYQSASAERQAHVRAQSDLIVEAIRTGDPKRAAKNLSFLLNLRLLDDPDGKMRSALSHPEDVPYLPAPQSRTGGGFGEGGFGVGGYGGDKAPKGPNDKP
jgi:hypothetical protein